MIERQKTGPATTGPRSYLETFAAIIRDHRLSHGAFRLWHALRDYTNHASECFPGQRTLAEDIACDRHRLKLWTEQLCSAGWLKVEGSNGRRFRYTVLDGAGQRLRKPAASAGAETRTDGGERKRTGTDAETCTGTDAETCTELARKPAPEVRSPINQAHLSESARSAEIPCWQKFWDYCQSPHCGLTAEWYARDKWEAANTENWKRMANWQAYARRCKGWWEADGRPLAPSHGGNWHGKPAIKPDHAKGF